MTRPPFSINADKCPYCHATVTRPLLHACPVSQGGRGDERVEWGGDGE